MFKTKTKKMMLTLAIAAVLAIGGTLAALSVVGPAKDNEITFLSATAGVDAALEENTWNAANALNLTPGKSVAKDPTIVNKGQLPIYTAIKVKFTNGNNVELSQADFEKLMTIITIKSAGTNTYSTDWKAPVTPTPVMNFYCKAELAKGMKSTPLFDNILINESATQADLVWLKNMNGFKIVVVGAGVQGGDAIANVATAEPELKTLLETA